MAKYINIQCKSPCAEKKIDSKLSKCNSLGLKIHIRLFLPVIIYWEADTCNCVFDTFL